jgi:hypothetical protein
VITRKSAIGFASLIAIAGLTALSHTVGCIGTCPDLPPVESGEYRVVEHRYGDEADPLERWVLDRAVDAQVTVDRETGEVTVRYVKDGTTYQVHYTIEGS